MFEKKVRALQLLVLFLSLFLLAGPVNAAKAPEAGEGNETVIMRGRVTAVENMEPAVEVEDYVEIEQLAEIEITSGDHQGETHSLLNALMGHPYFDITLEEGSEVLLWGEVDGDGQLRTVYLQDHLRDRYVYLIAGLFILLLLLVGGRKGIVTIITLGITVLAVFRLLLPLLLRGYAPIPATVLVATGVTLITIIMIGGLHRKTFAAVIGTVGGVLVAGLLALYVGNAASLTGFSSEDAQMLLFMEGGAIDVRGLLFAGIIIGALGAVMDVAMSIAAASYEVYAVNPAITIREQIKSGMNVGRAVMGTMANTLILAYVGASVPLLLLFMGYDTPYITIINSDLVATEVVRALAGSIGIIAAVPLTAVSAGLLRKFGKQPKVENTVDS
ncbi:MAG TPA: YibE/F family protein [Oscillospiraceae bacterium]|nr:YibE/F family protein [Oscillospiraceae bacterium]